MENVKAYYKNKNKKLKLTCHDLIGITSKFNT